MTSKPSPKKREERKNLLPKTKVVLELDSEGRAFLGSRETEVALRCSTSTLHNEFIKTGRLPYAHVGPRTVFAVPDVARLVAELRAERPAMRVAPWDRGDKPHPRQYQPRRTRVLEPAE